MHLLYLKFKKRHAWVVKKKGTRRKIPKHKQEWGENICLTDLTNTIRLNHPLTLANIHAGLHHKKIKTIKATHKA